MTVDEELIHLEESIRRLKIEYDVFFGGGSKRPPTDTDWRVSTLLKKFSDSQKLTYAQRFKYNGLAQRYAKFSDLWRQKLKIKEEGYRRPQDAVLGIQGLRPVEASAPANNDQPLRIAVSNPDTDVALAQQLFQAMMEAKQKAGEKANGNSSFESFQSFLRKKTNQIKSQYGCNAVEYSVEMQNGQVRLKAKAKAS